MIQKRSDGLDVVRSVAILLVVFGHSVAHSKPPLLLKNLLNPLGTVGVEIFFALSGFLIGGLILREVEAGGLNNPSGLLRFWTRRWLRTLPLYYAFLFIWLHWDWRGPFTALSKWPYFIFSQNLLAPTEPFFELSWSLAVEEWFYLIFPLLVFLLAKVLPPRRAVVGSLVVIFVTEMMMKLFFPIGEAASTFTAVRVPAFFRLDAIAIGVCCAYLARYFPARWHKLSQQKLLLLAAFLFMIVFYVLFLQHMPTSRVSFVLLIMATTLFSASLLPLLQDLVISWRPLRNFFYWTSTLSYSMYLGHVIVIIVLNRYWLQAPAGVGLYDNWSVTYLAYAIGFYAFAAVTYWLVERPFLTLRERIAPP